MSYPVLDTQHAAEAKALLTDHYRNQVVIPALLQALMGPIQTLENAFWDIINKSLLVNSPTGDQLNAIGKLVGAQRFALNDTDYLAKVILQIRVNRSQGLARDVIDVATLALRGVSIPNYVEPVLTIPQSGISPTSGQPIYGPVVDQNACYIVECKNLTSPNQVAALLGKTRSLGVYGVLDYTTWAPGNDFTLASIQPGSSAGQGGWGSVYTGSVGGKLSAGAVT